MRKEKLKYYLRGLGIGIFVTALILGIAGKGENALSDEQVRERAAQLGMIDESAVVLSNLQRNREESLEETGEHTAAGNEMEGSMEAAETESGSDAEGSEPEETESENDAEGSEVKETEAGSDAEGSEAKETESGNDAEGSEPEETESGSGIEEQEVVRFEIRSGATSDSVSRLLKEKGLVSDAKAFDTYLCNNGYSKSIRVGTYEIVPGTDEKEIAEMIAG